MKLDNLFSQIPDAMTEEIFETLLETDHFKLERIVSAGQATPPGEWYDQDAHEWVTLLKGRAGLRWRSEFPILETSTYLVSHSMGAMPRAAVDRLREYADGWQRDGVVVWERWLPFLEDTAKLVGRFLQAEPGSVVRQRQ